MTLDDIHAILERSGIGFPASYSWRSRSGCYFCFFQQKREWLGLREYHPDLFEQAKWYEEESLRKTSVEDGVGKTANAERHTWNDNEYLHELERPERMHEILQRHKQQLEAARRRTKSTKLIDILDDLEHTEKPLPCSFCHI